MNKIKIVFFATPEFSVPTLDMLFNHPHVEIFKVISMPDRPFGRKQELKSPEIIEYCKEKKIPYFQTENINKEKSLLESFKKEKIDLFIVLAFAQFLNQTVLDIPKKGCFNIHTSILPKYRGAAPIQYSIMNGDSSTGVSIQKMVKKMDAGDIVFFKELMITPTETGGQLYTRLKYLSALAVNDFVNIILTNNELTYQKQDERKVSFAPSLNRESGFLDLKNMRFEQIQNLIRALDPWPGTYLKVNGKRVKVFKVSRNKDHNIKNDIEIINNKLLVRCFDSVVQIRELQIEGKKRTNDLDFINGLKDINLTLG